MSAKYAVLWDLDGTLIDSTEYHWQAWHQTVEKEGFLLTREQFISCFGQRSETAVYSYCNADLSLADAQRIVENKQSLYREIIRSQGISLVAGADILLKELKNIGWKQALATSAGSEDVITILNALKLETIFDTWLSAESVKESKPAPEIFLLAASRLEVEPKNCIVVEDSAVGIQAAQQAGMKNIGVLSSHKSLSATYVVSSLSELSLDVFKDLLSK